MYETGEMAQQVLELAALPEDGSSVPSTYNGLKITYS